MEGKRVFLVEDSVVRATTLNVLAEQIRTRGRAREIHLRVACPPIMGPCFYGIDMSTVSELFAPNYLARCYRGEIADKYTNKMANAVRADSLRYLPLYTLAQCLGVREDQLYGACLNHDYPTPAGKRLYRKALRRTRNNDHRRTYE